MKKCSWCGKEYSDDATECAVDARPLQRIGGPSVPAHEAHQTVPDDRLLDGYSADAAAAIATRAMVIGGCWCVGGIAVTLMTYVVATESPTGGSYIVAWGAILFGGMKFLRGLALRRQAQAHFQRPVPPADQA